MLVRRFQLFYTLYSRRLEFQISTTTVLTSHQLLIQYLLHTLYIYIVMEGDSLDALCMALDTEEHDREFSRVEAANRALACSQSREDDGEQEREEKECPGMIPQVVGESRKENVIPSHNAQRLPHKVSREDVERVLGSRSGSNGIGSLAMRKAAMLAKKARKEGCESKSARRKFNDIGQGALVFKYSGLRIRDALVSSSQLEGFFENTAFVKLNQLKGRAAQDTMPNTWCTVGVVGEVSVARTSSQNTPYVVWKLTDLNEAMILLYVFGDAYLDYKDDVRPGSLIALASPRKRSAAGSFTLSLDSYRQVLVLGESADFGYCSEVTKEGKPCRVPVNVNKCAYCSHHVNKAYNKISSKRLEIQGGNLRTAFKGGPALKWKVGDFNATSGVKHESKASSKELSRVAEKSTKPGSMGSKYLVTCADPRKAWEIAREEDMKKKNAARGRNPVAAPIPQKHMPRVVCRDTVAQQRADQQKRPRITSFAGKSLVSRRDPNFVRLESSDGSAFAAELSSSLPPREHAAALLKKAQQSKSNNSAKKCVQKAPFLAHGLEAQIRMKENDASASQAKGPSDLETVVGKSTQKRTLPRENAQQNSSVHQKSSFEKLFGDVIQEMQDKVADTHVHSKYKDVVDAGRDQELMQTLDILEKKDDMAEKMDSVKKLKVSGWKCSVCNVTLASKHSKCMKEHPQALHKVIAERRWWKCSDCNKTFSTLGVKYPTDACVKCGSKQSHFESQSMKRDIPKAVEAMLTDGVACRDNMLARGREQKWVNE